MARNVARFLLPDPPREEWHLSRLFVNRERELAQALEQVAAVRKDDLVGPMAVVGQARVGKSHLRSLKKQVGLSAKVPGIVNHLGEATLMAQLGLEDTYLEGETRGRTVRVGRFEVRHLTELIGMAHVLLREHAPAWRTLFVLDDFDLLRRDVEGSFAPEALLQALTVLAEIPGFHALTTVRQDTYQRHPKAFRRVTNVVPFPDEGSLVEIYDRHVKLYWEGKPAFKESFVRETARLAQGRPGVFLHHLREAFMNAETDLAQLELRDWIRDRWERDRRAEPELAEVLTRAALRKDGILAAQELPRLRQSILMQWVLEDYTSESAARVDPLLMETLQKERPEDS